MLSKLFSKKAETQQDPSQVQPPHEKSEAERSLVIRLDIFLMTFGCISQIIKYLDQMNINVAYASGMKEDLELYGDELNFFTTYFNIAYCIMIIPSQILMTYIRPSLWLSTLELIWGVMTGLIAMCHHAKQVYALRAFLGLCEASAWPGMVTLLMLWYTPTELAKRIGFYHSCQAIGGLMSNAIQAAVQETMNGRLGLAGWRWLFIINAIMTVIWAMFGYVMLPDYPNKPNPRAFWFKSHHADAAMERIFRNKRAEPNKITLASIKKTFTNWVVYFIACLYVATVLAPYGYNFFNLWLKSLKNADGTNRWSISEINTIPLGGQAVQVAFVWIWAFLSDWIKSRWILIVVQALIGLIPCSIMSYWHVPDGAKYFSYFINYLTLGTAPLIFSWMSDIIPQHPDERALITGTSVAGYYAISAWSQVLVWPASQAPHYRYGWQVSIGLWIFIMIMTGTLRYIDLKILLPRRSAFAETLNVDINKDEHRDNADTTNTHELTKDTRKDGE